MSRKSRLVPVLWLTGIVLLLAAAIAFAGFGELFARAAAQVTPLAVLATLPAQAAASLLCAAALHALRPGVSFGASLNSRLLRDAGDNLLVFLPGLGEVIGARALVLGGGRTRAAVSAGALDQLAETLAQVPYIVLAAFILLEGWDGTLPVLANGTIVGAVLAVGLIALALGLLRTGRGRRWIAHLHAEWHLLKVELHRQKRGIPLSTGLHFLAWVMGGVQIWLAARALGFDISGYEAIAIESAAYAGRAILFFVPAGLGTQEAGLVAAGLIFGLTPAESLALGLVLRLRDLVFGMPLLAWPLYEWRHARRASRPA
jgi:hypothetical protein